MTEKLKGAINRLSEISWEADNKLLKNSYSILLMEYLRRASLLIKENSNEIAGGYPFTNFARELGGKALSNFLELCPFLECIKNSYTAIVCENYLEWIELIEAEHPVALKYFDLYEPLIKLFERGGVSIGKHHGSISICNKLMPIPPPVYIAGIEEKDISDDALDMYDSEYL